MIEILYKIFPFYILIFMGYAVAKLLVIDKQTISKLLVYVFTPAVSFLGIYSLDFAPKYWILILAIYSVSCLLSFIFLAVGKYFLKDNPLGYILGFSAGVANVGYFGLPIILALLGEEVFGLAIICITAFVLFENTVGFFIISKEHFSTKDCILKILRLPLIYAVLFGFLLNYLSVPIAQSILDLSGLFKGAYSVLGMMMIGLVLAEVNSLSVNWRFLGLTLLAKFVGWPVAIISLIQIDKLYFGLFNTEIYTLLLIFSMVPIAAVTVVFSVLFGIDHRQPGIAVLLSTFISIFLLANLGFFVRVFA